MHTSQMRSYEVARKVSSILEFIAWAAVVVGVIGAVGGMSAVPSYAGGGAAFVAAMPGLVIALFGLLMVAMVQNARAGVDTAELTQHVLQNSRAQLEISRQTLKALGVTPTSSFSDALASSSDARDAMPATGPSFADQASALDAQGPKNRPGQNLLLGLKDGSLDYDGHSIEVRSGKFLTHELQFETLAEAQRHIDQLDDGSALGLVLPSPAQPTIGELEGGGRPGEPAKSTFEHGSTENGQMPPQVTMYLGQKIEHQQDGFHWGGDTFKSLRRAKGHIDKVARLVPGAIDNREES